MKKLILLIALIYSAGYKTYSKDTGETRTTSVTVDISPTDDINILAKYTELVVETWDKNEVLIEATVRYDGKLTDKIEKFLNEFEQRVNDKISAGAGEVRIDTDLDRPNKIQFGGKHVGINISYGDDELKILYKIKAPGSNKYTITNSYEDVSMIGRFERVDFTQYSGKLEAESIGSAKMNMKYGSATIQNIEKVEMEIYEQEIDINMTGTLDLNAKYSDLEFAAIEKIDAVSYESDFEIEMIEEMYGNFKYGEINISEKLNQGEFVFYEMKMDAEEVQSLKLEGSKYSKFEFDRIHSLTFDQSYEDETNIGYLGTFKSENSKYGNHTIDMLEESLTLLAYEDEIEIDELGGNVEDITIDGKYVDAVIGINNSSFILTTSLKYGKAVYDESDVDVRRYIKENDRLEVEVHSKTKSNNPTRISVKGYEVDIKLD